jgi:hypothetical protein
MRNLPFSQAVLFASIFLGASTTGLAAGFGQRATVASMSQQTTGMLLVAASSGTWGNPDACTHSDRFAIDPTSRFRKEMLAIVLSAHLQGRELRPYFAGCTRFTSATFPTAVSLTLY